MHICWFIINYYWSWRKKFSTRWNDIRDCRFCFYTHGLTSVCAKRSFSSQTLTHPISLSSGVPSMGWHLASLLISPQDHVNLAQGLPVTVLLKQMHSRWVGLVPLTWSRSTLHIWAVPMSMSKKISRSLILSTVILLEKWGILWTASEKIVTYQKSLKYKQHRKCMELCQKYRYDYTKKGYCWSMSFSDTIFFKKEVSRDWYIKNSKMGSYHMYHYIT